MNLQTTEQARGQTSLGDLWRHLAEGGYVEGELPELNDSKKRSMPWYVAGLVGIAGWAAAAFLIAFLGLVGVIETDTSRLILGVVFCLAALGIKYLRRDEIFSSQLAFALSLTGQGLILSSQFDSNSVSQIVITVLILEGLLFLLYPDGLHRLLSFFAIIAAVIAQMVDWSLEDYMPLLVLLLAVGGLWLWHQHLTLRTGWVGPYFSSLSLGMPVAMLVLCFIPLIDFGFADEPWRFVGAGLGIVLLFFGLLVLRELDMPPQPLTWVALVVTLAILMIPSYETPGVMAATLVLGLGFWRRQNLLIGIGIAGLGLFISFYYYNLDLTLLVKSIILMGSGIALLIVRVTFKRFIGLGHPQGGEL